MSDGSVDGGVDGDEQAERQEGRPLLMQKKSKAALLKLFFFLTLTVSRQSFFEAVRV